MPQPPPYQYAEGGGNNPPYGEDFFQRIVGVHWREPTLARLFEPQQGLVGFSQFFGATSFSPPYHTIPIGGDRSFGGVATGASGRGYTVLSEGKVAFGGIQQDINNTTGTSGRDCFMVGQSNGNVDLFIIGANGKIGNPIEAWDAPGALYSVSYANGLFFVAHNSPSSNEGSRLAVSFDGINFSSSLALGVNIPEDNSLAYGGSVAYSPITKKYVTVGQIFLIDHSDNAGFTGTYMAWAVSTDGYSWSAQHAPLGVGPMTLDYGLCPDVTTVAFGNGVFVAAAAECTHWTRESDRQDFVLPKCAVAVSDDGSSWSLVSLPGAKAYSSSETGGYGGGIVAVGFVQTEKNGNGYFVATGFEYGSDGSAAAKIWMSDVGSVSGWSLVQDNEGTQAGPLPFFGAVSSIDAKKSDDPAKTIIH